MVLAMSVGTWAFGSSCKSLPLQMNVMGPIISVHKKYTLNSQMIHHN